MGTEPSTGRHRRWSRGLGGLGNEKETERGKCQQNFPWCLPSNQLSGFERKNEVGAGGGEELEVEKSSVQVTGPR